MQSMTGFARVDGKAGNSHYLIEIKSVNHRYLDIRFKLPPALLSLEIPLSNLLRDQFDRGSFDVLVKQKLNTAQTSVQTGNRFVVDESALKSFLEGAAWLKQNHGFSAPLTLEQLVQTGRIFVSVEETAGGEQFLADIRPLFDQALSQVNQMRATEGTHLKSVLKSGLNELLRIVDRLNELAPTHPQKVREKLEQKIQNWQMPSAVDKNRLEWEIAFYAERASITEELDRLFAHTKEFEKLMESDGCMGRKLDFLTQELHREINTLGAKASALEMTRLSVDAKTVIEKLREQVQNVE